MGVILIVIGGVIALVLLAVLFWGIGVYNSLVQIKNNVQQAFSNIDVLLKQRHNELTKLVEVVKVMDLCEADHVERELMLIKVRAAGEARQEIKRTADIFRGQIVDVTADTYTVQLVGPSDKLDAFLRAIDAPILEVVRSGVSGVGRGDRVLSV